MLQPKIGVSACLLGQKVRYDGQHKYHSIAAENLRQHFQLIPICPEVESGMGVPRAKIQLTRINGEMKLQGVEQPDLDVTQAIRDQANIFLSNHGISGMVLKDKSPSCGIGNAKIVNTKGAQEGLDNGLFADTIIRLQPELPLIQANELHNQVQLQGFIECVKAYYAGRAKLESSDIAKGASKSDNINAGYTSGSR